MRRSREAEIPFIPAMPQPSVMIQQLDQALLSLRAKAPEEPDSSFTLPSSPGPPPPRLQLGSPKGGTVAWSLGLSGSILQVVQDIYSQATIARTGRESYTTPIPQRRGVKQGCPLSPILTLC